MNQEAPWGFVKLYGVEHSPWVQGVLLALTYHGIPTTLTSYPLSMRWWWTSGVVFPALQLEDGSIHPDSFQIYELMEAHGVDLGLRQIEPKERLRIQAELEHLFSVYALGRCIAGKRWRFIKAWSVMRDAPATYHGAVCRSVLCNYFWLLIQIGIHVAGKRRATPYDLNQIEQLISAWDQKLRESRWLTGEEIGFVDFALWGHVQCMASGLTDELLPLLKRYPHLIDWVKRVSSLEMSKVSPYAQRLIDDDVEPQEVDLSLSVAFWGAWLISIILWPLTLTFIIISLLRRHHNPAHSGAVAARHRETS